MRTFLGSIALAANLAFGANIFSIKPSAQNLDTSSFPPLDETVTPNPAHMTLYDFSKVPNITVNTPYNNIGPANCSASDPNFGDSGSCCWSCGNCVRPTRDIVTCYQPNQWGLTFDDGPSPYTPTLLTYLAQYDIRATFFVVGSRVKEYPNTLVDIFNQGHQIGVHTWSHRALTTMTTPQVVSELQYSIDIIKQITGTVPKYMRPPFGDIDDRIRAICDAMNLIPVMWDWDTDDRRYSTTPNPDPSDLQELFKNHAARLATRSQGTISLQHDLYQGAVALAANCINEILAVRTITPMPVSECFEDYTPYTDSKYSIPNSMSLPHQDYVPSSGVVTSTSRVGNSAVKASSIGFTLISFTLGLGAVILF